MSTRPRPATSRARKSSQQKPNAGTAGETAGAFDLANRQADPLTGQILVAMPTLTDPNFAQTVILICAHGAEGAMGIILNRSLERPNFEGLLQQLDITPRPPERDIRLCAGGPVENVRGFVVHTLDWIAESTLRVDEGLGLTTSLDILKVVAQGQGPRACLLALGYAGWGPGQLETEFGQNSWLTVQADEALVFEGDNETRWRRAMQKLHVDPALLSLTAGHA
ncbi:YqgE/AlgH family protein [Acidisoma sp.]|uniref:YqgE/AlgH family protein n=1 Tax=Acidisoma sp. TaxID=1872115 RepID=UPI003B009C6A